MKTGVMLLCGLALLGMAAGPAGAGGIINKSNWSTDYIRTLNRFAATDEADIAVFNPAGIMTMTNGTYAKLDILYFGKDYSNTVPGFGELSQDTPSLIPSLFVIHKQDRLAGFFAFTVPAGGGKLEYDDGSARTVALGQGVAAAANAALGGAGVPSDYFYNQISDMTLDINASTVYGFTFGGSVALTDRVSASLGARFAKGKREFEGGATISASQPAPSPPFPAGVNDPLTPELHLEEDASGWAGILGLNFAVTEDLNVAATYITNTSMDYEIDVLRDTMGIAPALGYADGSEHAIDIPGQIGLGVAYRFTPSLTVHANHLIYMEKDADINTFDDYGNSTDTGLAVEYAFNPRWKASVGYLRTNIELDDDQQLNEPEEPKLDANTVGAGFVFSPTPVWDISVAGLIATYDDVTDSRGITYEKSVWNLSVGAQRRF
ncbi:MAG: hypothetical protein R6X25_10385 [Candidatus Krumholzibacteriia bacterium]